MKSQTVSLLVRNEPGVLARISVLIARFGYNINKLSVEKYKQSNIALILIELCIEEKKLIHVIQQLDKLIDVIQVKNGDRRDRSLVPEE